MNSSLLDQLLSLTDARLHQGADVASIDRLEKDQGILLPDDHRLALYESNGAEAYGGYIRLFGVESEASIDSVKWNKFDFWKFSWGDRCANYWCFAETAWGDQYAYRTDALQNGGNFQVYLLDCLSMTSTPVASSFTEFLDREFIRSAISPYDAMIQQARRRIGDLEVDSHLIYVPSPLLGGEEDVDHIQSMNARSAMICNGDVATQLDAGPSDRGVTGVQPYADEFGRMRLKLLWS